MKNPSIVELNRNCKIILCKDLLSVAPNEGCALLLGNRSKPNETDNILEIKTTWPCCNIWKPGIFNLLEPTSESINNKKVNISKRNRFAIDPREQISAQRWARSKGWEIVGSAHSHPKGSNKPSAIDLYWAATPSLMIIVDKQSSIKAWWITNNETFQEIEVAFLTNK